jgi:hypothetical protein
MARATPHLGPPAIGSSCELFLCHAERSAEGRVVEARATIVRNGQGNSTPALLLHHSSALRRPNSATAIISRSFHEKAGFVKAAVAARRIRDLRQTFCLASIRTLLSRFRLGAC